MDKYLTITIKIYDAWVDFKEDIVYMIWGYSNHMILTERKVIRNEDN